MDPIKPHDRWLWKYLPANTDEIDFLYASGAKDRFEKWGKLISYYPAYWQLGAIALQKIRRKKYDMVVAWEGKNGFPFAMLRSAFNQMDPPLVILTFIYRGLIRHFKPLAQFGMRSVDHITVTTQYELDHYKREFSLEPERISLCPFHWYDSQWIKDSLPVNPSNRFVLASGRSFRDYTTLAKAVQKSDVKVRIIARKFNIKGIDFSENVETTDLMPIRDYQLLLHQAQFVVLPLFLTPHSAGDSHIVQSMSASKAVIASRTPSPETYIKHGATGLLVSPGSVNELREAIRYLWENPQEASRMGREARLRYEENYTYEKFAQRVEGLLAKVYRG